MTCGRRARASITFLPTIGRARERTRAHRTAGGDAPPTRFPIQQLHGIAPGLLAAREPRYKPMQRDGDTPMLIVKLIASIILNMVIFGALLFVPAGTLAWWRAWVFLGVVFIASAASMFGIFPGNEELLNERYKLPLQEGQPLADKIVLPLFVAAFAGAVVFIPLDVFRFRLLGAPGAVVSAVGLALFVAGWTMVALGFRENSFAAPVVKHQAQRHQTVIDTGVYSVVRHPMYTGGMLLMVGMPLWLGSYAAALLALVPIGLIAVRIVFEERFLRRELTGYIAYLERVRYRLIPFVW
jgi:protein-S-isoprenylcysteine O-methyltransferase Ste14